MKVSKSGYEVDFLSPGLESSGGVLLKFDFADGLTGYADLHPWPELGDPEIPVLLESLGNKQPLPMAQRAMDLAREDAQARADSVSLFQNAEIPPSHYLALQLERTTASDVDRALEEGFTHIKVKMRGVSSEQQEKLSELVRMSAGQLMWRIDFNAQLSEQEFVQWAKSVYEDLGDRIDFVEDPFPYREAGWKQNFGLSLALDRACDPVKSRGNAIDVVIAKPDLHDPELLYETLADKSLRLVITNNLGHPFGHSVALWAAAKHYGLRPDQREVCGLQGLQYYSRSEWTEQIRYEGPKTVPPTGTGFGFDSLLAAVDWRPL